jgi:cytochrome c biogenesis protein CcmG/thiol:disulfide interchange protein DsbE
MHKLIKKSSKLKSLLISTDNNSKKQRAGKVLLVLTGCCLLALTIWLFIREDSSEKNVPLGSLDGNSAKIGKIAPQFTLENARDESQLILLSNYYGQPVILNFYASWCEPCRREIPDFEKAANALAGKVTFIGINFAEDKIRALGILKLFNATYLAALDRTGQVGMSYGLQGLPYTVFIDADGIVRAKQAGLVTEEILVKELGKLNIIYHSKIAD